VQLSESEKLQDLLWLWGKLADTSNSNDKGNLWLGLNEEVSFLLSGSLVINELLVGGSVLVEVLLGVGGSGLSGDNSILLGFNSSVLNSGGKFLVSCLLLKNVFWNNSSSKVIKNKILSKVGLLQRV